MRYPSLSTYAIALLGGCMFQLLHIPIPFILGPVTAIVFAKSLFHMESSTFPLARDIAFVLLGIQIGHTFTSDTFTSIFPYMLPYALLSFLMIGICLVIGLGISKRTGMDKTTSMVGSSPGGLSAMIAISESLQGNSGLVTIFHTLRLMSVLFIIPFFVTHMWGGENSAAVDYSLSVDGPLWTVLFYILVFFIGMKGKHKIPAGLVVLPMIVIGAIQTSGLFLYSLPSSLFSASQLMVGTYLGHTIMPREIVRAGKSCFYFLSLSIFIIAVGILFAFLFSFWTGVDIVTSVLALAPGGLVEMSITAGQTGGDPAVVSSLQTIRLLTIVLVLPLLFKRMERHIRM
ncbi:AbrB family transcriptional regulator [Halobacillus sp. ACCC02827]|uniref:AbrB family transcriptional regulator n=1 Tax=Bacillaceae TaxID=186817 RepID=UPI0003F867FE|nr:MULTISPECIES: AbrB family transcriptional regulator [Bacillaceae]QHT46804.1 AbrB family transcriptional regulator [Bacillus sp. SB49]WJE14024.1 AbrB family transcriptional regulator [Halobacillus sp. ACCC02827]